MCNTIWENAMSPFNFIGGDKKFTSLHTCKQIIIPNWFNTRFLIGEIFSILSLNDLLHEYAIDFTWLPMLWKIITNHSHKSHKNIQNITLYKFISYTKLYFKANISNQNIEVYLSIYNTMDTPSNGISRWTLKFTNVKFGPENVISC